MFEAKFNIKSYLCVNYDTGLASENKGVDETVSATSLFAYGINRVSFNKVDSFQL